MLDYYKTILSFSRKVTKYKMIFFKKEKKVYIHFFGVGYYEISMSASYAQI